MAEDILEKEHYGLEKVKERILEFLAVRKMLDASESPILCLVGPPGTGKTSVARSTYAFVWAAFMMRRRSADTAEPISEPCRDVSWMASVRQV